MSKKSSKNTIPLSSSLVVTSNDLVLAKYNFSLWQKRVFNYFVGQIDKDAREFKMQRVYISDLIRFFNSGDGKEVYDIITNIPKQLYNLSLKIPYISEEGHQRYGEMRIITGYTKPEDREKDNAYIEFKFNDDLKPHLLELKRRFSKYDLHNIVGLQSTHSIRMFEILKSYEYQGEVRLEVEYLKTVLELGDKYKLYADFRRYVIDRSKEDLEKYCDISFDYKEIKKSRKVDEILFTIKRNNINTTEDSSDVETVYTPEDMVNVSGMQHDGVGEKPSDDPELLFERVNAEWNVSKTEFLKRMKGKAIADAEIAIDFTKEKIKEGKANNPAGIFLDALAKGFKTDKQHNATKHAENQAQKRAQQEQLTPLFNEYDDIKAELFSAINDQIRLLVEQDPSVTERAIALVTKQFETTKRAHLVANKSVEDFRQLPVLREAVIDTIKKLFKDIFEPLEQPFLKRLEGLQQQIEKVAPTEGGKKMG